MNDATMIGLRSALRGGGKDEFGVRQCCSQSSPIWDLGGKKQRTKHLGVGAAAVESDDGLLVCETGWDNEWFGVGSWFSVLVRVNRSRHGYVVSRAVCIQSFCLPQVGLAFLNPCLTLSFGV